MLKILEENTLSSTNACKSCRSELICKSVPTEVFVPYGRIEAKIIVLLHHHLEDADSYASFAARQKTVPILSSSFSSPVTA